MSKHAPKVALRTEAHASDTIIQYLSNDLLDIGVLFNPEQRSGFKIEHLFDEPLVLVATSKASAGPEDKNYLFVDWGPGFHSFHTTHFPHVDLPGRQTTLGAFGIEQILVEGGSGYFPEPVVRPFLREAKLHRVKGAPRYATPLFAVYRDGEREKGINTALVGLRQIATQESRSHSSQLRSKRVGRPSAA
jgi:DNA-binding transcriptional LysR family regulator